MIAVERAIVLHSLKYADNNLIIRCLTNNGIKSFFVSAYIKNNKNKYPFLSYPLPIVDCTYFVAKNGKLPKVKNIDLAEISHFANFDFRRNAFATFAAECAVRYIKEEDANEQVFIFLNESIAILNKNKYITADFPIKFGFKLAEILGFGIKALEKNKLIAFIDRNALKNINICLKDEEVDVLFKIISTNIDQDLDEKINNNSIKVIFKEMLKFFKYHFPNSAPLKSPEIIHILME